MKLYELDAAYRAAFDTLPVDEETGEILDESALAKLDEIEGDLKAKLCAVAAFSRECVAEADEIKKAYAAMQAREKALRNRADWLKSYAKATMLRTGCIKAESPYCRVSLGKPVQKVEIQDVYALPPEFIKQREPEADKVALKKALKEGACIPGAALVEGEPTLRIA